MIGPDPETVYVALLNEGTDVWRPAKAVPVDGGYLLLTPPDYDAATEHWAYPPGTAVRCEVRTLSDGPALVACARLWT